MEKICPCIFGSSSKNKAVQASDFLKDGSFPQSDNATGVAPGKEITSIPPNSPWSGCAAKFSQPVTEDVKLAAQDLVETVYKFNCSTHEVASPLPEIVYRYGEEDILRHVFRWDLTPYEEVFQNGFTVNRQENTPDNVYYSLDHYLHHGGRPLDSRKPATHAFISTTVDTNWHLSIDQPDISIDVYRYEIYAPGGIWVAQTLGDRYQYPSKDEVCFVAGIAPQYIRSAQCFRLSTIGTRNTKRERVDNMIRLNGNFHPQSHPSKLLDIEKPIFDFLDEKGRRVPLKPDIIQPRANSSYSDSTDWYAGKVANSRSYINAAFRSSCESESYLFMKNEYVMLNYAPGTCDDKLLIGPDFICNGFPSLAGTSFAEHGIDCAFGSHDKEEAFLFSGNLCARINYVPHTTTDKIINGPMTITAMFPFLKGTVFEEGIDAAIESTTRYQVYLFKNNQYARIHYNGSESHLIDAICPITQAFPSLKNTIFESGIDSAFASHRTGEAYLFKDDFYALFYFGSDAADDYLISSVKKLLLHWPSLCSVLPRQNHGLDFHDYTKHDVHRVQDEL